MLVIPSKRHTKRSVEFLNVQETAAPLAAPDLPTRIGLLDCTLLLVAVQTGLRSSELRALRGPDVELDVGAYVSRAGKGHKTGCTPLRGEVVAAVPDWLTEQTPQADDSVFRSLRGDFLSADALQRIVNRHVQSAHTACVSLQGHRVTPHTLRHTGAMVRLQHGGDLAVIALWLGHESIETTHQYLHANVPLKERALGYSNPAGTPTTRFQREDSLLVFLEGL